MQAEPHLVTAPSPLWRVERIDPPLRFSLLNPVDALNDQSGNRFDIAGGGVLYGATAPEGGFAETLAAFRPSASMVLALHGSSAEPGRVGPGQVPQGWFATRRMRTFNVVGSLPFVDLESPATHLYLTQNAAPLLRAHSLENLDVASVRGPSRLLTRAISSWLYSRTDEHGRPLYAGIRYVSRLGDFECWAVFDGTAVELQSSSEISPSDATVQSVLRLFGINPA